VSTTILTVEKVTKYIRDLLASDRILSDLWIEGEVSSFTTASSGHGYFALQDDGARMDAVIWKTQLRRQSFIPRVGDKIIAHGEITIYEKQGRLQFSVDVLQPAGIGLLQLQLEQLRQKLQAEGLFDPSRKRPIPTFPHRIGVATSATGAVWHDIQNVIRRRFPLVELVLAPTLVQGDQAPDQIVAALSLLQAEPDLDLIILARGGGSLEDLWSFNDERVARAIFASRLPVISAIGHETDVTIADHVADLRAPTPSAAAELAVPDLGEIAAYVAQVQTHLRRKTRERLDAAQREIIQLTTRLHRASPQARVAMQRTTVTTLEQRLRAATTRSIERRSHALDRATAVLTSLNPTAMLNRGYALLTDAATGKAVSSVTSLDAGDAIRAHLRDGAIDATVDTITPTT